MYLRNSGFAPHRRQGGFIQGAILFALVIIAVVVAAFSLANRDSQNNADSEQAKVNSTFILKVGNDLQSAVNRAIADGADPATINTQIVFTGASSATSLNLFDTTLRYLTEPNFPETALANPATAVAYGWETPVSVSGVGGTGGEQVINFNNVAEDVCVRINNAVNGTLVTAPPPLNFTAAIGLTPAWREGCVGSAGAFSYFRVVVTDAV